MILLSDFDLNIYQREPLLIVISGLSGSGKDSIVEKIKEKGIPFYFVVTATTRAPRENEQHGVHYFFYSHDEFEKMIEDNALIEYAMVYDQYKGVPRQQVESALASGMDVVMRIDYQGARRIRELYPQTILLFVLPENTQEWYDRLISRGQDDEEQIKIRLNTACEELKAAREYFDYVVINQSGRLDEAAESVVNIIRSEHLRIRRVH